MSKIDRELAREKIGTRYPEPYNKLCNARISKGLSDAGGLTQFGVYETILPPGKWASQRHWHSEEDEFIYILSGECTLIDNDGETLLTAGECSAHIAGDENGHHLVNKSDADVVYLIVGTRNTRKDHCHYPDIDMDLPANGEELRIFKHKNGKEF